MYAAYASKNGVDFYQKPICNIRFLAWATGYPIPFSQGGGRELVWKGGMARDSITRIGLDSILYLMKTEIELKDI